jgi:hypothetical protein
LGRRELDRLDFGILHVSTPFSSILPLFLNYHSH